MGDWGSGLGLLSVYVDDLYSPVLVTPMDLGDPPGVAVDIIPYINPYSRRYYPLY